MMESLQRSFTNQHIKMLYNACILYTEKAFADTIKV